MGFLFQFDCMKIKQKLWINKKIDSFLSRTDVVKLALFTPELKSIINNKLEISQIDFENNDV